MLSLCLTLCRLSFCFTVPPPAHYTFRKSFTDTHTHTTHIHTQTHMNTQTHRQTHNAHIYILHTYKHITPHTHARIPPFISCNEEIEKWNKWKKFDEKNVHRIKIFWLSPDIVVCGRGGGGGGGGGWTGIFAKKQLNANDGSKCKSGILSRFTLSVVFFHSHSTKKKKERSGENARTHTLMNTHKSVGDKKTLWCTFSNPKFHYYFHRRATTDVVNHIFWHLSPRQTELLYEHLHTYTHLRGEER